MSTPHWPVTLVQGDIRLRPLRTRDSRAWQEVRRRNADYLKPWDATMPDEGRDSGEQPPTFASMVRRSRSEARAGRLLPWAIEYEGRFVGQLTIGGIALGSLRSAYIGYWIDQAVSGKGITTMAVAMGTDFCFADLLLHRLEINIRPENLASRAVAEKVGYTVEGTRSDYLHIDGAWRDHVTYVLFRGQISPNTVSRIRSARRAKDFLL
jgi:[ribosomal protein S5]-alanine N-acetyltransferase